MQWFIFQNDVKGSALVCSLSVLCRSTVIDVFAFDDLFSEMSGAMLNEIVAMETEVNESEAKATEMAAKVN